MSFYLKYRPRKIEELDLESVRDVLKRSLGTGMAHAYLFVGPRGSGKTSAARILAKIGNCEKGEMEPCLECVNCKSVEEGSLLDVLEIDAASHRGIDSIRELRDKIGLAPVAGRKKVYIIDEVHMLTTEAFNALLKTLEEPPAHALFVLCTTEEHKVPETIVSRCVRVGFVKAMPSEVKRSLKKVLVGEKMSVDEEALDLLARSVDGSFREGHKLLEQLAGGGKKIGVEEVAQTLGQGRGVNPEKLGRLLLEGDTKAALVEMMETDKKGVNWASYSFSVLKFLQGQLRASFGLGEKKVSASSGRIGEVVRLVAAACVDIKMAVVESLPMEMVAIELEQVNQDVSEKKRIEKEENVSEDIPVIREGQIKESKKFGQEEKEKPIPKKTRIENTSKEVSLSVVLDQWGEIIAALAPDNHSVAGLLRSCKPKAVEDNFLVIEAFYKFHKDQLEQESRRRMVEQVLGAKVGLHAVKFVLGEKAQKVAEEMAEHDNLQVPDEDVKLAKAVEDVFGV